MNTQSMKILNHLKQYGSITSKQAFMLYGCTRLSARIYDFRKLGYVISSVKREGKTRYGRPCQYAEYVLALDQRGDVNDGSTIYQI